MTKVKKMAFGGMGSPPSNALKPMPTGGGMFNRSAPPSTPYMSSPDGGPGGAGMFNRSAPPLTPYMNSPGKATAPTQMSGLSRLPANLAVAGVPKAFGMKKGGKVSSASSRADGIAQRGKTRGKMIMCGGGMAYKGKK
jgi:hypothetical protein